MSKRYTAKKSICNKCLFKIDCNKKTDHPRGTYISSCGGFRSIHEAGIKRPQ